MLLISQEPTLHYTLLKYNIYLNRMLPIKYTSLNTNTDEKAYKLSLEGTSINNFQENAKKLRSPDL